MRKITSLFKSGARVYLLISDKGTDSKLRKQAEAGENGLCIFRDKHTLISVGFVDHVCFGSGVSHMGDGMPIVRIDVEKYFSESQDYFYKKI